MTTAYAIEATGLRKRYGDVIALDGIDLAVERGIVFGLLGPNGAGKTTAVRILTTLLAPDAGSARVDGVDVLTKPALLRERIGLAGQYAAVDENLTGFENLAMVGRLYHFSRHEARQRARQLLADFDLADAQDRLVRTYSGGMRRRLDLAAALVARPPVVFLDEPTTGLDPRSRIALWGTIENLVASGTTVLLTTQYLDEADRLASELAVVDRGQVIAEGTPAQLKADSGGEWLELRLTDPAEAARAIDALQELAVGELSVQDSTVRVPLRTRHGAVATAVRLLDAAQVSVDDLAVVSATLNDVFLRLTGHAAEEDAS
jgi:ABC-2 type transport system ATP-binding protein